MITIIYIIAMVCSGVLADTRGRRWWVWVIIAFVASPLAALAILICLPKIEGPIKYS